VEVDGVGGGKLVVGVGSTGIPPVRWYALIHKRTVST
jgi:hypothetical protein